MNHMVLIYDPHVISSLFDFLGHRQKHMLQHFIQHIEVKIHYSSTNPALDIGQAEGAFVMGLGYWLTEECKYDPTTGELVTNDTWVRLKP